MSFLSGDFGAIEVDDATSRVFVSSPSAGKVRALSFDGVLLDEVSSAGAGSLLVDGTFLLVASTSAGRIEVFDTTTLDPVRTYGNGTLVKPNTLAKAGGRIWTSTGTCGTTRLVSIDPTSGLLTEHPPVVGLSACPQLYSSPIDPDLLLGFDASSTTVLLLDVGGGAPSVVGTLASTSINTIDAAVLPGGDEFVLASGSPSEIRTFSVNPLAQTSLAYPTGSYPNAVAVSPGRGGLVAAAQHSWYDDDIDVYKLGDPSVPVLRYDFGSYSPTLTVKDRGIALSGDASRLFVISTDPDATGVRLNVFSLYDEAATATAVAASPPFVRSGQTMTITARVTPVSSKKPVTGTVAFSDGALPLGSVSVDDAGRATIVLESLSVGVHAITAAYGGSVGMSPSAGRLSAWVRPGGPEIKAGTTALPDGYDDIAIDDATQRVFVSSPGSSTVTVLDFRGAVLGVLTVRGAGALLIDGPRLWVSSTTYLPKQRPGRIEVFDTTTLTRVAIIGESWMSAPGILVKAGGRIWTSSGGCNSSPKLVSINPANGKVVEYPSIQHLGYCPFLFTSPTDANVILGFDLGIGPTTVVRLDVSSGAPIVTGTLRTDVSYSEDAEVMPDGQTFTLVPLNPSEIRTFRVNPLQPWGPSYQIGTYANAVDASPAAGGTIAFARDATGNDVDVFRIGEPAKPLFRHDFGTTGTVRKRGVAFSQDGTRVFVVTRAAGDSASLRVLGVKRQPADYDGDGLTDIAVYRPSTGQWWVRGGASATWGIGGDVPVPADYDGDGITDIAVYRPSTGQWFATPDLAVVWGTMPDTPLPLQVGVRESFFP